MKLASKKWLICKVSISVILFNLFVFSSHSIAQTSWKGTVSTNWRTTGNWTAGVPTSTVDAIIGDASFTGAFQPVLTITTASCKSLTIGTGSVPSTLTISKNLNVSGNITIGSNGTILHTVANQVITLSGNWVNTGTYSATVSTASVVFSGTARTLLGATVFQKMTINSGCTLTLASNITVNNSLSVSGTLDPTETYLISGTGTLTINNSGTLKVKAANFTSNYSLSGAVTINSTGTVNYASALIDQNISNAFTYGFLRISGGMTKFLIGNLPPLNSTTGSAGRIYIDAGTMDLQTFTANRGTGATGGNVIMAGTAKLKIGGTNGFPSNYNTKTIASTNTVEYYGNNQTVAAVTYGNLTFSSSSGVAVKTMSSSNITIAGNLSSSAGAGAGVTFTAGGNIIVNKVVTLDTVTTFNGGNYSHTFKGNWINSGTFNGNTSTVTFRGVNSLMSGSGINNFYNLVFSAAGISASATTAINVSGNLSTAGSGVFTHNGGGTLTMTGTTKTISGSGLKLYNLIINGTVTMAANVTISGDFTVNSSFTASSGTFTMNGTAKTIAGSGTITFNALSILGSITTSNSFIMLSSLPISLTGSFTATAGTITFNGSTTLSGKANLFNVTINSAKTLALGSNSVLGIANTFTKTGTFNVTSYIPNTTKYNSAGAQTVVSTTYNNLILENGGNKTPSGNITVNNDFTINAGVTFSASTYTHSIYRHFTNSGAFTCATSTIQLLGTNAANITGATTFNNLTVNKSSTVIWLTQLNNVTTNNLTMTQGNIQTGSNSITITGARTGAGIIIGTITHNHAFTNGTAYYFESSFNALTFTAPSVSLTSVTITVIIGEVADFDPAVECVAREYAISIPAGTYTNATLRLHYLDNELNAFDEPNLSEYKFNTGTTWDSIGVTTRSTTSNYVEKTGITAVAGRWTLSGVRNIVRWNGSVSSAWETAANWTTISGGNMSNRVPNSTDDAEIGKGTFTNHPVINSVRTTNVLRFGSAKAATLTINSGSLTIIGNIRGEWSAAATHTLDVASGSLIVGTNLDLSNGITNHNILLKIGSGSATINNDLSQKANGGINFTGSGTLTMGGNFNYTAGSFTAGTGTVIYTGGESQQVAPVTYNNLSFTKTTERAVINFPAIVNGNLITSSGGEIAVFDTLTVSGNITIGAGTNLIETGTVINSGGNWTTNGSFTVDTGTVNFNGTGNQTVNANMFNNLVINKPGGTLTTTGDITINNNLTLVSGTVDLSTYLADRTNPGGVLTLGPSSLLKVSGANNFPNNYITTLLDTTSTVVFNGTIAQNVLDIEYGNLTFSNGGSIPKTILANMQVNGNLLINTGATLDGDSSNITVYGNFTNNGTYTPTSSTLILSGLSKTFSGTTALYNLDVAGSYSITSGNTSIAGDLFVGTGASLNFGNNNVTLDGDLTNKGSLTSNGTATFTGTRVQTMQLLNAITSASTGVINFNGTVSPVLNSSSAPTFATVNINNTGGITPSTPWTVYFACNIAAGATFDAGSLTHTFYGNFTNNGTVISNGEMKFTPIAPFSTGAAIKLDGVSFTSTGKVEFGGTVPITLTDNNPSLNVVYVTNTNVTGVTPPNSWTINDELYIGPAATFKGGTALTHVLGGNLTNNGTLDGGTSTITFIGTPVAINGLGTSTFYNLTISSVASLDLNRGINIMKNFVNNGLFDATGRIVTFSGTVNSVISGTASPLTFDYLEQNKTDAAATTSLSVPVTVTGNLTMTSGIINTTAANMLTLLDDANADPGNDTSFVNGPLEKTGDDAFVFPIGKNGYFHPLSISAPASASDDFIAEYMAADPHPSYSTLSKDTTLHHLSRCEYWMLNRNSGTSNVNVTLSWNANSCGVNSLPDLRVAQWNGIKWKDFGNGGTTGNTAKGTVISAPVVTTFGPFTLASPSSLNPLPVELISFDARYDDNKVALAWTTASEINNDYFMVERSAGNLHFEEVTRINGAGNSDVVINYTTEDLNPLNGISYYRLKQVDFNGAYKYSNTKKVNREIQNEFTVYPNPSNHGKTYAGIWGTKTEPIQIAIYDATGKQAYSKNTMLENTGYNNLEIELPQHLTNGIYLVIITTEQNAYRQNLIIN